MPGVDDKLAHKALWTEVLRDHFGDKESLTSDADLDFQLCLNGMD